MLDGGAQARMAMVVKILRRFRVAQLHVLAVVDAVAFCLGLFEGVLVDPMSMEDTMGRRADRGYLCDDRLNVLPRLCVHIDARCDVCCACQ